MYKVLIVDDEKIIRIALKSMISWEDQGFTICGAAADSTSALDLMHQQQPHLMIIDIMMPKADGLTLLKLAREQGYQGQAVILTNHQDFQYAVDALHNGAFDYMLKTDISQESLTEVLARIKKLLDSQINPDAVPKNPENKSEEIERLFQIVEHGLHDGDEHDFSSPYLFLAVFLKGKLMHRIIQNQIPKNTLRNIIQEVLGIHPYPVIQVDSDEALIIISQPKRVEFISSLPSLSAKIQKLVNLYMNTDCGFVCSNAFYNGMEFFEKLRILPELERLIFYTGFSTIIQESDLNLCVAKDINLSEFQIKVKLELAHNNYAGCKEFLNFKFQKLAAERVYVSDILNFLSRFYEFLIFDYSTYLEKSKEALQDIAIRYQSSCTLEEYLNPLCSLIDLIEKNQISFQTPAYREEIQLITEYIRHNMDKKITLSMVAAHVNRSENYLSRLFKAETGVNIINFINSQKMERAKELLADPTLTIKEISLSLGYDEASYFNKLFNKHYRINPSDYRKMLSI